MRRILIVSSFPPVLGGISIGAQRLYEILTSKGYDVTKFNTHFNSQRLNRVRIIKYLRYSLLPFLILLNKRYDVIHFRITGILPKLYISIWRFIFSRKTLFLVSIHGEIEHILRSKFGSFALKRFDRIVCVKPGDSENLPPFLKCKTVEISGFIPPVISDKTIDKIPEEIRHFLNRDTFKILINGKIICNRDFHDLYGLIDSIVLLEQLRKEGKNVDLILVIIDHPSNKEAKNHLKYLKEYITEKKLNEYIFWAENISMELWPIITQVNVLLRPTKSDGDALSVREALYLGVPVIASNAVPRPSGTIIYDISSQHDLFKKCLFLIENYNDYVSKMEKSKVNFADQIIHEYENWNPERKNKKE